MPKLLTAGANFPQYLWCCCGGCQLQMRWDHFRLMQANLKRFADRNRRAVYEDWRQTISVVQSDAVPPDKVFMIPTHLNITIRGGKVQILDVTGPRDLTKDELRHFAVIQNLVV